jgi:hypothetical protein
MEKYSTPLRYGFIGGIVMCIISIVSYMFYNQLFGSLSMQAFFGFAMLGIIIFIPVWGTVTFKRQVGVLSFGDAFIAGMIIISITLFFSSTMSYVIPNVIDTEYPQQLYERIRNSTSESMEKFGASDEQIEESLERIKLEDFQPTLLTSIRSFGISLGVSALLCLLIAAFVSRKEKSVPTLNTKE